MRILIIGGTRFIGREVVHQLHGLGHTVTVFHRGQTRTDLPNGVRHIFGNRKFLSHFRDEVRSITPNVVLDMIPLTKRDAESLVATFQGIATRLVAISSQDVYRAYGILIGTEPGAPEPLPLYEESPLRQVHFPYREETVRSPEDPKKYLDDYEKILVERIVMENPHHPGTILRLPMVYGPNDYQHRFYEYIKRMADGRPAIFLDPAVARWRATRGFVANIARAIVMAVLDDRAVGGVYNVGEMEAMSTIEWIVQIGKVTGWEGQVIALNDILLPDYMRPNFNTSQHLVADCSLIREELGFQEIVTLKNAIEATYAWEAANPPENINQDQFNYHAEDRLVDLIEII
jgi:nucleoside-diphosphate-sugar epimerase